MQPCGLGHQVRRQWQRALFGMVEHQQPQDALRGIALKPGGSVWTARVGPRRWQEGPFLHWAGGRPQVLWCHLAEITVFAKLDMWL